MTENFVHLHLHSEYSMVDSLVRIQTLIKAVVAAKMPAVAITDHANLFALVKFYKAAVAAGLKPIVGVDAWLQNPEHKEHPFRIVLLAQNQIGYRNLTKLVSRSYQEGQVLGLPRVEKSWLMTAHEGLIVLSGGREGDVGQALLAGRVDQAKTLLTRWQGLIGDRYYLELVRTGRDREEEYLQQSVELASHTGVPVVATNDVCFLEAKEFEAHEARVCINQGHTLNDPQRPHRYSQEQYLRTPQEMVELFADLPEAIENALEIACRCNLEMVFGKSHLPQFPVPTGVDLNTFLHTKATTGLQQRLNAVESTTAGGVGCPHISDGGVGCPHISDEQHKIYAERLERELAVIVEMGFPGYFLIVADFIQWARDHDIPVGPGRGSGAGSLVAYALRITDIDPIPYDLLFERFLNPERVSMPDFDVDFCMEGRDRVIEYVAERYGRDAVAQIITYGSMAAKAVVRDVGRVLGLPLGLVDRIAKLIPFEIGITLQKALDTTEELRNLYAQEEDVTTLLDMAQTLEGLIRNAGKHAGGVVIAPGKLTDFVPLYCEEDGQGLVTQFDKDDVEQIGLVKFDFLGLRTLTIIAWALQDINNLRKQQGLSPVVLEHMALNDQACFDLLKRGDTTAVFQLESRGMKELIKRLKPDTFEDIIALVALYRPGPLGSGMVDDFIKRKHGMAKVEYPHPSLESILKPTYGTILYQEQVMQIAQVLAGFSLGRADLLRRAMGKKSADVMDKQRAIFIRGASERGVAEATAEHIFALVAEFANYGFNKSHSAAYALLSYQTAWLKAHYPAAFMAAVLSADLENTDKVVTFIEECRRLQITVQPPDLNRSEYRFTVDGTKKLLYGLGAIKGVGTAAIDNILEVRRQLGVCGVHTSPTGIFRDLFDFCRRVDLRKVNRRVLDALIRSGAMDSFGIGRAMLLSQLPLALQLAEQYSDNRDAGLHDFFGVNICTQAAGTVQVTTSKLSMDGTPVTPIGGVGCPHISDEELLQGEKATLGLYLTRHPVERYIVELQQLVTASIADLLAINDDNEGAVQSISGRKSLRCGDTPNPHLGRKVTTAGLVIEVHHRGSSKSRMGSIVLDDRTGRIEVAVFAELYQNCRELLQADQVLLATGMLSYDDYRGNWSLRADQILNLQQARERGAERLNVRIHANKIANPHNFASRLRELLAPHKGGRCPVLVECRQTAMLGVMKFSPEWRVHPNEAVLKGLRDLLGHNEVWFAYGSTGRESLP